MSRHLSTEHKQKIRFSNLGRTKLNSIQQIEICNQYKSGKSSEQLSKKFNCGIQLIWKTLKRNGFKANPQNKLRRLNVQQQSKICKLYASGKDSVYLSKKFDCCRNTILKSLRRNNIFIRPCSQIYKLKRKFPPQKEIEICNLYTFGETCVSLSKKFWCDSGTILRALRRNNIKIRTRAEALILRKNPFSPSKSATTFLNYIEKEFGIVLEREFPLKNKLFDGRIGNILIEIDGKYWHTSTESVTNDLLKDEIARNANYQLYRFEVNHLKEVDQKWEEYLPKLREIFS